MNDFETTIDDMGLLSVVAKTPLAAYALKTWAEKQTLPKDMFVSWSPTNFHSPYARLQDILGEQKAAKL